MCNIVISRNSIRLKIYTLAEQFRISIEKLKENDGIFQELPMNSFPSGCCMHVSQMLGYHLLMHGYRNVYCVCEGTYKHNCIINETLQYEQSHAWLDVEGYYVDITGDQFENRPAVDVSEKGKDVFYLYFSDVKYQSITYKNLRNEDRLNLGIIDKYLSSHII